MPEFKHIDPNELQPGPIRHESLPPELLELIHSIYEVIGPYLDMTLEDFEIGFKRDANPEREVGIWCSITAAWSDYHEDFLGGKLQPCEDEKKLIAALDLISMGVRDEETLGVPEDVGQRLLDCYAGQGEE